MIEDSWSSYLPSQDKLLALYSKGKSLQWDAERGLDWSAPIDPSAPVHQSTFPLLDLPLLRRLSDAQRELLTASFMRRALSQFLHGEQGALMVAAHLVTASPDYEAKLFAATQTMDEARHVEVFNRYVRRLGELEPITTSLRKFLDQILGARSWLEMLVGMQIIVEGAALSSFHAYRQRTRDPLLSALLDGVLRDEARHVGFGNFSLKRAVDEMKPDEREALADYAFDAVLRFAETRTEGLKGASAALESVGVSLVDVMKDAAAELKSGRAPRNDPTRDGIADFIVPTLRRIGVMTPRMEERLAQARIPPSTTSPLLEQLDALVNDSAT